MPLTLTWHGTADLKVLCDTGMPPPNDSLRRGAAEAAAGAPLPVCFRVLLPSGLGLQCSRPDDSSRCHSFPMAPHSQFVARGVSLTTSALLQCRDFFHGQHPAIRDPGRVRAIWSCSSMKRSSTVMLFL